MKNSTDPDFIRQDDFDYESNSQIKNIYLKIKGGYNYNHQSLTTAEEGFIGRKQISDSFRDILNSQNNKGVYLVTGYRGMGKTSFVKQVLKSLKKEKIPRKNDLEIKEFFISLAQSQVKDTDILKHIVNLLLNHIEGTNDYKIARWYTLGNIFGWLWPILTILLISINFYVIHSTQQDDSKTIIENLIGIATLSAILTVFFHKIISWTSSKYASLQPSQRIDIWGKIIFIITITLLLILVFIPDLLLNLSWIFTKNYDNNIPQINPTLAIQGALIIILMTLIIIGSIKIISTNDGQNESKETIAKIHERLKILHDRCNSQVTKEDQIQETFAVSMSALFNKHQKIYPIANPREIENELILIIEQLKDRYQYIFVFDELDKVDPNFENIGTVSDSGGERITYLNDLRERRHLITNILASLKYFVNEAEAKFIFIAGREMFEAALADISDRQSSISSIFHKVIYVDSFLKDRSESENHISAIGGLVETYLASILLEGESKNSDFFSRYYKYLTQITHSEADQADREYLNKKLIREKEARKIIFTLSNFLGYLVYRSNGSPKKMTKLLEEYIRKVDLTTESNLSERKRSIVFDGPPGNTDHYLYFSYLDQYKLGYTAYLFQPFLTMNSSFMKRYSDNTLVSISYLIDNLIKFHPFAFSAQNLELLPEILATSRTPISRPFLEDLVSFLAQNHIRRTESGLYEYKFYDRTHNEITFISKLFEDEAAAFNFTLDETFSIKTHLKAKIRHLRSTHLNSNSTSPVVSIIFLNRLLGDAHFQDEEYQDAIISYQDALQVLNIDKVESANQITSFILIKLKLGLTYEKIKAYELGLSHYVGVIEKGSQVLLDNKTKHKLIYRELLVMMMQAFLATLYLQEKLQEGITFQKIKHNINQFTKLLKNFKHDYENRDIIAASFFGGIGSALYFKNMVLPQKVNVLAARASQNSLTPIKNEAVQALLDCFSLEIEKELILQSQHELEAFNKPESIHGDARVSFSTYVYYKKSIKILLGSEENGLLKLVMESTNLISPGTGEEITYRGLQHTKRLSNLGHNIAKMGDLLLPLIKTDSILVNEGLGCFYFDFKLSPLGLNHMLEAKKRLLLYLTDEKQMQSDIDNEIHPRFVIHQYYLAAIFYLEAGDKSSAVFQLRKTLLILRSVKLIECESSVYETLLCLEFNLIRRILELSSLMSHSSDRPQLAKFKKYFEVNTNRTPHHFSNELYANLSNNPDTKETILAYALLKSKYHNYIVHLTKPLIKILSLKSCFENIPEHKLLSPYNSISHQITRLLELDLHTQINFHILNQFLSGKLNRIALSKCCKKNYITIFGRNAQWENEYYHRSKLYNLKDIEPINSSCDNDQLASIIKYFSEISDEENWFSEYVSLVLNSIFSLTQIKRILNTFGSNYILSYSYLANIHQNMGTWLKHLQLCRMIDQFINKKYSVDKRLNDLIGQQDAIVLDTLTEYQMALQYYYQANQMHKEGLIYRNRISNLIYLEDDFNDNLYHFGAALERLKIKSKSVNNAIEFLKGDLQKANMYKYSTFTGDECSLAEILRNTARKP